MIDLAVPYLSQLDNQNNSYGSCNVTCVAMVMGFLGHPLIDSTTGQQLEDELYRAAIHHGLDRHNPADLAKLIQLYGYKDGFFEEGVYQEGFQPIAKWGDVKKWLDIGKPCICHGWFTRAGHIIVIRGYNDRGWIVNDPYGEWWSTGYDTNTSGEGLTYSYGMMREVCGNDGDLWVHFVSK